MTSLFCAALASHPALVEVPAPPVVPLVEVGPVGVPGLVPVPPVVVVPALHRVVDPHRPIVPVPPVVVPALAGVVSSQFHAQDEFGNVEYGYKDVNSAKTESGNAHVGVTGGYQYVDTDGQLQTVNYVADALGFRVADSRLPEAPVEAPGAAPEPVTDTPEVAAAREEFLEKFAQVAEHQEEHHVAVHSVTKREALSDPQVSYGYNYLPYRYGNGFYTPLLAYHNHRYPYVAGYGPQAYIYSYRH